MARILAVGNATLDIINVLDEYPAEDQEVRARSQHIRRGGNATNTLVVLSQLGHQCAWAGCLADEPDAQPILSDLARYAIDTGPVHFSPEGKVPTSYVVLNRHSGSRTIIHYRKLPEYSHRHFSHIDLTGYDWLHLEGRNVYETRLMLEQLRAQYPQLPCSLEVEKPHQDIEQLFSYVDLLLFSKAYLSHHGFHEAVPFLQKQHELLPHIELVCAWGEHGAYAMTREGKPLHSPAFPPAMAMDTLGAGDVFNAGIIDQRARGHSLDIALIEASRLAGKKCGQYGLDGLVG